MKKHLFLIGIVAIIILLSGCSTSKFGSGPSIKIVRFSARESKVDQFQLEHYGGSYFDETEYVAQNNLEIEICGESFVGEFLSKERRSPFMNELHRYGLVNTEETYDHKYSAWAWINPKSEEVVLYSSWYETERQRGKAYTESELTEIANQLASQYIDLNEYELTINRRDETETSDYIFYYDRSIGEINGAGRIVIFLTCDGHLLAFHNTMNSEWDNALTQMGG